VSVRTRVRAPSTALLLTLLYFGLAALHVWEASRRLTPTVFSDEIEFTQLSRSIADTGSASYRDGMPARWPGLYPYVAAPAWWLSSVGDAYDVIKTLGALLMTAVVFPAYGLARLVASRPLALAAAAGAGAAPVLAYAPVLVEEPLAYPLATTALWLVARWLERPTAARFAAAAAACVVGFLARNQLEVLAVVLVAAAATLTWRSARFRRRREGWTRGDRLGAAMLALGGALATGAVLSHHSTEWYVTTTFFKSRMLDFGLWGIASLAIGIGVLPLVALLAVLVPTGRRLTAGERAFTVVAVSAIGAFGVYAAVKGAYLSTTFASLVPERNVVYLTPVLFAGTAWLLERRSVRLWALVAAAAVTIWLVVDTPYGLNYPNYEAHGFSVLALANRIWRWDDARIEHALILVTLGVTVALVVMTGARRRVAAVIAAVLVAGTLAWTTTAEVYATHGENALSQRFYDTLPKPPNWLDRLDGDSSAVFLGQGITDANPIWSLEFWNRSLKRVWSLDATAPGPGYVVTPNLGKADGTLDPTPGTDWVVATPGVSVGEQPGNRRVGDYVVRRLNGPIRLASAAYGIYPDGWMGQRAEYDRYDVRPGEHGLASITVSRIGWCGKDKPGRVTVRLGPLGVTPDGHSRLAGVTEVRHGVLNSCEQLPVFLLRAPPGPWRVEVEVTPTFSPHELDPQLGDARQLGAQVSFDYRPFST